MISIIIYGFVFGKLEKEVPHRTKKELGVGSIRQWTSVNTIKQVRYIFSDLDIENSNVLKYKKKLRKMLKVELLLVVTFIFILFSTIYIGETFLK